ncbi:MAG: OmpH family outer membrane protein [Alphaproteobacteria bacterium]
MYKLLTLTVLAASLSVSAMAAELKVAVLDGQMVINQTNAAKRAVETLKGARDAAQKQIAALEAPLVDKQKKLADQQKVLAPDKFAAEQQAFQKDVAAFRAKAGGIQTELEKKGLGLRKQIADTVRGIVESLSKQRGYDLVVPKAMVFYTSANVTDISAEVLAQANAALDK